MLNDNVATIAEGTKMGIAEDTATAGRVTYGEIEQQFDLWPISVQDASQWSRSVGPLGERTLFTGAGSSAFAAAAIAACWPGAVSVATTDLLLDASLCGLDRDAMISIARSGDSPESVGVVKLLKKRKNLRQFAITCNAAGSLARQAGLIPLLLDPRTNDHALAMTGSFSNLVLAGMALRHPELLQRTAERLASAANQILPTLRTQAQDASRQHPARAIVLGSFALYPLAREAALKITELTGGRVAALSETFLGLRHGPMSYLRSDTLILCFLSTNSHTRQYELDVLDELRTKQLGRLLCVAQPEWLVGDETIILPLAPELPDHLRTPFEVVFAQLFAFYLSKACGLDPDVPSPDGVIHRIVQGVRVYER